jgi:hypothetical protein
VNSIIIEPDRKENTLISFRYLEENESPTRHLILNFSSQNLSVVILTAKNKTIFHQFFVKIFLELNIKYKEFKYFLGTRHIFNFISRNIWCNTGEIFYNSKWFKSNYIQYFTCRIWAPWWMSNRSPDKLELRLWLPINK